MEGKLKLTQNPKFIAVGCFLQMFLGMGLCSTFSMMLPEMSAHTGFSTGVISWNLTFAYAASFIVSVFLFKPLLAKFGAKKLLIFGDLLLIGHYLLYSYAESLWMLRICGTLGGLVTLFACATPVSVVITNWFVDKRSSVLAVIMGGYGFGGMIIMSVIGRLIAAYGYQVAYRAHSAAGLILLLVTIIFIRDTPEQMGVKPYGWEKAQQIQAELEAKKALNDAKGGITLASARKTKSYWLLWIGLAISSFPGVAFRFYNGAFFKGPVGLDTVTYSDWAAVLSVCIAAGMLLMGIMSDNIGAPKMVIIMHVVSIAGYACAIVLMKHNTSFALLLITVILCGMNGPLDNATAPYLIPEAFGRRYYDEIIGSYAGAMMIGNIFVPLMIGGIISDATYESFTKAWWIIIGCSVVAMILLLTGLYTGPFRKQFLAMKAQEKQEKKEKKAAHSGG